MTRSALLLSLALWSRLHPPGAARWLADRFLTPTARSLAPPAGYQRQDLPDGGVLWREGKGRPQALLIHGWSGSRAQFDPLATDLRAQGFGLNLLDPPGHGAAAPGRSGPHRFLRAITEAADRIGPLDLAIGHSMGGAMLLHLALGPRSDLAGRLVAVSAPHGVEYPLRQAARMAGFGPRATDRFLQRVEQEVGLPRAALALLPRAAKAPAPLLLIHDRTDPQIPFAQADALASAWPGAELVPTSGAGHNRTLAAPETRAALAHFAALPVPPLARSL